MKTEKILTIKTLEKENKFAGMSFVGYLEETTHETDDWNSRYQCRKSEIKF